MSRIPRNGLLATLLCLALAAPAPAGSAAADDASAATAGSAAAASVVLLHGLGRSGVAMRRLERGLSAHGYAVHNLSYPSRDAPLEQLAHGLAERLKSCCADRPAPLHFVTHSMGGIVLRTLLEGDERPANLGRVVMMAPPNHGSPWVDELRGTPLFRWLGPAAAELGTDEHSALHRLGPVDYELGVLAGSRSWNPLGSWLIPGDDDGTVGVASARVDGMRDFRVLPTSHSLIVRNPRALAEVVHFLEHGAFSPAEAEPDPDARPAPL